MSKGSPETVHPPAWVWLACAEALALHWPDDDLGRTRQDKRSAIRDKVLSHPVMGEAIMANLPKDLQGV